MNIITHARLIVAEQRVPQCSGALDLWYRLMKRGTFRSFAELKSVFGTVDKVGNVFVFNIGGNKARLVAAIHFNRAKVFVRYVLTHEEYDREDWKEDLR
jgi:mRNA interferase HigB